MGGTHHLHPLTLCHFNFKTDFLVPDQLTNVLFLPTLPRAHSHLPRAEKRQSPHFLCRVLPVPQRLTFRRIELPSLPHTSKGVTLGSASHLLWFTAHECKPLPLLGSTDS